MKRVAHVQRKRRRERAGKAVADDFTMTVSTVLS